MPHFFSLTLVAAAVGAIAAVAAAVVVRSSQTHFSEAAKVIEMRRSSGYPRPIT